MTKPLLTVIKWAALFLTLSGAVLTSMAVDPINIILLNGGSIAYMVWAWGARDRNLFILNATLLIIYLVGLITRYS